MREERSKKRYDGPGTDGHDGQQQIIMIPGHDGHDGHDGPLPKVNREILKLERGRTPGDHSDHSDHFLGGRLNITKKNGAD